MNTPLSERLIARLSSPDHRAPVTVRTRFGETELNGSSLLQAAELWDARWRNRFGQAGHVFVVALPPGELFLTVLLAGMIYGHTLVPVAMPRQGSHSDRWLHVVGDCDATAVLCTSGHADLLLVHTTRVGGDAPVCPVLALDTWSDTPATAGPPRPSRRNASQPAIIQYTSGSTRAPKGVCITDDQILANCARIADSWGFGASDTVVNWLPHYHDMGLFGGILFPLLQGAPSVQMSPLDMIRKPSLWLRAVSDHRASFSGGPAFGFAECLKRISEAECAGLDLSNWRSAFCGAEPVSAGLLTAFRTRFAPFGLRPQAVFACYGLAEFTLLAAGAPETLLASSSQDFSATAPCTLTDSMRKDLRIVDPEACVELPEGQQGEIWLRGGSKGIGYINLPDETEATFNGVLAPADDAGWLRTGDLGVVSGVGLYVTGRLKDVLIANGQKVAAAEFEWLAAQQHPSLNPFAAAAFMPAPNAVAEAVLLIELKSGEAVPADPEGLRKEIARAVLGEWGIALTDLRIVPRGDLARTSSGKIRRQHVAESYRQTVSSHADNDAPLPEACS